MLNFQEFAGLILCLWLFAATLWDLRQRDIPRWFSLIPLTAGLIHLAWGGYWPAALCMTFSILSTHINHPGRCVVVAAPVVLLAFMPGMLPLAIGWSLLYLAWELRWLGGADALAGAYLLIWFPGWEMLAGIVLGILVWNVGVALIHYGKDAGLQIWTTTKAHALGTSVPGMGAFLIALSASMCLFRV